MIGILTMSRWCEAMEAATGLGLPWRLLREKLAPMQPDFPPLDVHYNLTIELLDTDRIVSTQLLMKYLILYQIISHQSYDGMKKLRNSEIRNLSINRHNE